MESKASEMYDHTMEMELSQSSFEKFLQNMEELYKETKQRHPKPKQKDIKILYCPEENPPFQIKVHHPIKALNRDFDADEYESYINFELPGTDISESKFYQSPSH